MTNPLSWFMDLLLRLQGTPAYLLVGVLTYCEAAILVGFVLPGETAVLLAGILASQGAVSLPIVFAVAATCTFLGDVTGYALGRRWGPHILATRFARRRGDRIEAARTYLRERGGWAIFVGRWTAFLRATVPMLAGISQRPFRSFAVLNGLGGLLWAATLMTVGYVAGNAYESYASSIAFISVAIMVIFVLILTLRAVRRQKASPTERTPSF
ncbi:DedA family protein [Microbispora sp. NPDC049125]|uniref:DedA family protein n=1 Tax=Microbispora sp. NPDC049125 TaxID=3154929 RepID=UPI003465D2F6